MAKSKKKQKQQAIELNRKLVLVLFGLSGGAALIYEVIWTRALSLVFGSSVYAVSTMLTAFMSGLTLGSFLGGRFADRIEDRLRVFASIEIGIGVFGLISVLAIDKIQYLYFWMYGMSGGSFNVFIFFQFLMSLLIMLIPTSLMGATFPIAGKLYTKKIDVVGRSMGELYSVNTLGSIAGSFGAGFILIPFIGVKEATMVAALINLLNGCVLFLWERRFKAATISVVVVAALSAATLLQKADPYPFNLHTLGSFATAAELDDFKASLKEVYMNEDVNGQVAVFDAPDGKRFMRVSGRVEGSNAKEDMATEVLLGSLPFEYRKDAKSALVIGLGTGITLSNAARYPVNSLRVVDINGSVIEASRRCFSPWLEGVLKDRRVEIEHNDGRNYLLTTHDRYDVISSEPSYPTSQGVANLFTREFYEVAKSRLAKGGILCQWAPKYIFSVDEYKILTKTMGSVFKKNIAVFDMGGDALFLCSDRSLKADAKKVRKILKERGVGIPAKLYTWTLSSKDIEALQNDEDIPLNSDDHPVIEYHTIWNIINNPPASMKS